MGHRQSPILNDNKLKLGFFSPNCCSGMAVTRAPERWVNSWENNIRLARLGDEAGIEFVLPIARWIGYGGETDFHGSVLETVTWATGLLANTRHINVFATVHIAFIHPVVAAKQLAEEYLHYYADELADWDAVDNLMRLQGMHAQSFPAEALEMLRGRFAAGHGTYPLVGDPDHIASELAKVPNAGFTGCTLSFVDYAKEFPYFRDEVIPRLEKTGLRNPANRPG